MRATTEYLINLAARLHRADPSAREYIVNITRSTMGANASNDASWEGRLATTCFATEFAFIEWLLEGFPLVVFDSIDHAHALAETDPPTWEYSNPYHSLGIELGDGFVLAKSQWNVDPDEETPDLVAANWDLVRRSTVSYLGSGSDICPFTAEQLNRLIVNVLITLLERPEGLTVTERRRSAKAARKRGRRYYPGVEYVIGSARPLWKREEGAEDAGSPAPHVPQEGWTLSVRTRVRGHWTHQVCGPRNSLRRVQWIRPHWRSPEGAPISAHATRFDPP